MRSLFILLILLLAVLSTARAAEPFEIREGDRVLFLGDVLLEREGTYGYLETRMHEQFPDRKFTVRNLSMSGDTPLGWSRASFDPAAKGFERLKEQLALVRPTVVFLGYGMAASLQEMTDRSGDITLNRDTERYGAEPYSAARFKKELGLLMDAIVEGSKVEGRGTKAENAPAPEKPSTLDPRPSTSPRFVLLSPIRHEDLRKTKPGLPDPAEHNKLLEQYSKAIEELATERGGRLVSLGELLDPALLNIHREAWADSQRRDPSVPHVDLQLTSNGIHLSQFGARLAEDTISDGLGWGRRYFMGKDMGLPQDHDTEALLRLRAAILKKNELFFHRWRPENHTYIFGFRKHEQGQNAKEIPMFDPLIDAAEAEIDRLKRTPQGKPGAAAPAGGVSPVSGTASAPSSAHPAPFGMNPAASGIDPAPFGGHPAPFGMHPAPSEIDPTVSGSYPALSGIHPAASGIGPAAFGGHPAASRSCPALSGIHPASSGMDTADAGIDPVTCGKAPDSQKDAPAAQKESPTPQKAAPAPPAANAPAAAPLPLPQFDLDPTLEISLWAENPLLEKPTEMNWDAAGRLWVCSSGLYPQIAPGEPATDRILILEDTDHDGKADKSTVFAEGLLIPTGVEPDFADDKVTGGQGDKVTAPATPDPKVTPSPRHPVTLSSPRAACYVGQSTELLRFEDTDGDGKADTRRIVLSGFGTEDTHHIIHTLRWGPDGRLYFNQSIYIHSHLETPWGMVRMNSGAVMAYDPRTERVEVLFKGFCNPWGHAWDRWGQSFITDGAGFQGISWGILGAQYFTYENGRNILQSISPGSYPKFAGLELIQSPHFPADWQGNAITCDFRAHRIVRFHIEDLGAKESGVRGQESGKTPAANLTPDSRPLTPSSALSGYITKEMPDIARTADVSFRPIDVKLGPDGALYVADWSNPVINHGEVDFRDPRRDHTHGRIWRISVKGKAGEKWEAMAGKKPEELLEKLLTGNLWDKQQARSVLRMLHLAEEAQDRRRAESPRKQDVLDALVRWLKAIGEGSSPSNPRFEEAQLSAASVVDYCKDHALSLPEKFLKSPNAELRAIGARMYARRAIENVPQDYWQKQVEREHAMHLAAEEAKAKGQLLVDHHMELAWGSLFPLFAVARDTNPRVRLEVMRALSKIPTGSSAALVLTAALNAPKDDPYYAYAAALSINDLAPVWTEAIASGAWTPDSPEKEKQLAWGLAAIRPDLATATVAKLVAANKVPLDGSGPWIELLGQAGGPAELDRLWARVQEKKIETINTPRLLGVLSDAAKVRGVRPTQPADALANYLSAGHAETERAAARLAGAWKFAPAVPRLLALTGGKDDATRNFAFDALREIGDEPARIGLRQLAAAPNPPPLRGQAAIALAALDLPAALPLTFDALAAQPSEDAALNVWRGLLSTKGNADGLAGAIPKELPKPVIAAGLRAARESGKAGEKLLAALTPLAGAPAAPVMQDFSKLAEVVKRDGDPARGEEIYRRAALACVTCHAIGGAGGHVGPELTSMGASAPLDYIIESVLVPAAKVKEGFNAVALTLKDGTVVAGIQSRETAQEWFVRDVTGAEKSVPKANVKGRENIGSLMPAALTDQLQDRERIDLYAFLAQLGKPGVYDASKAAVARVWWLFPASVLASAVTPGAGAPAAFTNVDGRLTRERLAEALQLVPNAGDGPKAATKFQLAAAGKVKLNLTGVREAWLDGQGLAVASEPSPTVELAAGVHTFAVRLDPKALPEVLRIESAEVRFLTE